MAVTNNAPALAVGKKIIRNTDFGIYTQAKDLLAAAEAEAQSIRAQAKKQAEQILEDAKSEAEQIKRSAQAEIVKEKSTLQARVRGEVRTEMESKYAGLIGAANLRLNRLGGNVQQEVVDLTLATVRHLFGALPRGKRVAGLALRALEEIQSKHRVELRVHPDVLIDTKKALLEAAQVSELAGIIDLAVDAKLKPEEGQLFTHNGMIRINLEEQLKRLTDSLKAADAPAQAARPAAQAQRPAARPAPARSAPARLNNVANKPAAKPTNKS